MEFNQEEFSYELVNEMYPLWKAHYEEIATYKDIALDPDLERYEIMARGGFLRIFTARDEGSLVGYQVFFVTQNPHYKRSTQAVQDILFLSLVLRKGLTGYKFIKWCDERLKEEKIQLVFQHVKEAHDFTPMLRRLGYQAHDKIMVRRLS